MDQLWIKKKKKKKKKLVNLVWVDDFLIQNKVVAIWMRFRHVIDHANNPHKPPGVACVDNKLIRRNMAKANPGDISLDGQRHTVGLLEPEKIRPMLATCTLLLRPCRKAH
jgi:hypothetical protein